MMVTVFGCKRNDAQKIKDNKLSWVFQRSSRTDSDKKYSKTTWICSPSYDDKKNYHT